MKYKWVFQEKIWSDLVLTKAIAELSIKQPIFFEKWWLMADERHLSSALTNLIECILSV